MASEQILTLTTGNFEDETKKTGAPILVDFWAEWCGPCRQLAPVLDQLAKEYDGRVRVGKLNVDDHSAIATKFGVMSIPTLLLFKEGKVIEQFIGFSSRDNLAKILDKHLS